MVAVLLRLLFLFPVRTVQISRQFWVFNVRGRHFRTRILLNKIYKSRFISRHIKRRIRAVRTLTGEEYVRKVWDLFAVLAFTSASERDNAKANSSSSCSCNFSSSSFRLLSALAAASLLATTDDLLDDSVSSFDRPSLLATIPF